MEGLDPDQDPARPYQTRPIAETWCVEPRVSGLATHRRWKPGEAQDLRTNHPTRGPIGDAKPEEPDPANDPARPCPTQHTVEIWCEEVVGSAQSTLQKWRPDDVSDQRNGRSSESPTRKRKLEVTIPAHTHVEPSVPRVTSSSTSEVTILSNLQPDQGINPDLVLGGSAAPAEKPLMQSSYDLETRRRPSHPLFPLSRPLLLRNPVTLTIHTTYTLALTLVYTYRSDLKYLFDWTFNVCTIPFCK